MLCVNVVPVGVIFQSGGPVCFIHLLTKLFCVELLLKLLYLFIVPVLLMNNLVPFVYCRVYNTLPLHCYYY